MRLPTLPPTPAVVAVTTAGTLPVYLTAALAVLSGTELGFGPGGLGALVALQFAVAAISAWVSGRVADRVHPPLLMKFSVLIAVVSMAVAATAPSLPLLSAAMLFGGVANGLGQPASNALLAAAVDRRHQGRAFGLKQAAIPLSILVAATFVPLVAVPLGWRVAYAVGAVLALVLIPLVPGQHLRGPARDGQPTAPPRRLPLVVLAVGTALGAGAGNVLGSFLIPYAVSTGLPPGQAGILAAVGSGAGVLARVGLGEHADRRGGRHLVRVAALLVAGSTGFLLLAVDAAGDSKLPVLLAGALLGYVAGWSWAGLLGFAVARMHPGAPGRATGGTLAGAAFGGAAGPLVAGLVVRDVGFAAAWLLAAGLALAAAGAVILGRRLLLADPNVAAIVAAEPDRRRAGQGS